MELLKMKNIFFITYLLLISSMLFANSGGGEIHHAPSLKDLFWPAVNFSILFAFLFFKLKKPINEMFINKSKDIEELYFSANKKDKESQSRLDIINQKFKELSFLREDVMKKSEVDLNEFKAACEIDKQNHEAKQKNDLQAKVTNEKQKANIQLKEKLLKTVLNEVKLKIKNNESLKAKVTNNLLSQLK